MQGCMVSGYPQCEISTSLFLGETFLYKELRPSNEIKATAL